MNKFRIIPWTFLLLLSYNTLGVSVMVEYHQLQVIFLMTCDDRPGDRGNPAGS
jgi:hypothetical protein